MTTSLMARELGEAPARVRELLKAQDKPCGALAAELRRHPPAFAATLARGSSDQVAAYAAALFAMRAGCVTASLPPSLFTRYRAPLRLHGSLVLAVSQSGQGPDLCTAFGLSRRRGARTVALVNDPEAPLAAEATMLLEMMAGPEHSVAATKTVLCSLVVTAWLAARWGGDEMLERALAGLPDRLEAALSCNVADAAEQLAGATSLFVLGRGPALAVAGEMALKCKETAAIHAEAVSSAEIRHGPRAALAPGMPVLCVDPADACSRDTRSVAEELERAGCPVFHLSARPGPGHHLPLPPPLHPLLDPIVALQAFYPLAERLARLRGRDPDRPGGLAKVTRTY